MGVAQSKSRSLDQILEKPCYHFTGYNFDPIFIQVAQDDYLDEWMNPIENGCGPSKN